MPQPTPYSPTRSLPFPRLLSIGLLVLTIMAAAGCTGSDGDDQTADTVPVDDGADEGSAGGDNGMDTGGRVPDGDVLDRLTYAEGRPVLDPDGPPEVEQPELASPDEQLDILQRAETADAIAAAAASPDVAILDVAGIVDDGPTADEVAAFGDGNTRGPTGELVVLDEQASLACADVELALTDIDAGRPADARTHVVSAAERSGRSSIDGISAWSGVLAAGTGGETVVSGSVDPVILVGFLSVCVDGGYAL